MPPVVVYPVLDAVDLRQVIQPPLLECAIVAIAPFGAVHTASTAGEIRESQPIVACAVDLRLIAPIVILRAIGCEVNESDSGLTGRDLIIEDETLKEIQGLSRADRGRRPIGPIRPCQKILTIENLGHNAFSAMSVRMEHLADRPLIVEAHDHKAPIAGSRIRQRGRITPKRSVSGHDGFVQTRIWESHDPHFIELIVGNALQDVEARQDGVVIYARWVVRGR